MVLLDTIKGLRMAVIPNTKAMLVILEPIAFPTAVSGLLLKDAVAETTISGAEDPIATIVSPIIMGETPMLVASAEAP
ncbi:hypothetical protein GCM10027170_18380 [Aliiglaciecola aliphaticivorans]